MKWTYSSQAQWSNEKKQSNSKLLKIKIYDMIFSKKWWHHEMGVGGGEGLSELWWPFAAFKSLRMTSYW